MLDQPEGADLPLEVFADRFEDGRCRISHILRTGQDLAHRMRSGPAALRRFAFSNGGSEQQARACEHTHERLEQDETLMHLGTGKGACTAHRVPDGHCRRPDHDERGDRRSAAHCGGDHERKDDVLERMVVHTRPAEHLAEDKVRGEHRAAHEQARFSPLPA